MSKEQIEKINALFVATNRLQALLEDIQYVRENAVSGGFVNEPYCILVTGETGTGKSEFIKQYFNRNQPVQEDERTKIPVFVSQLPKVRHPKPVVAQLLRDLGDPLNGTGGDTDALTHRLVTQLKGAGVEIIIIDEFQHREQGEIANVF